MRAKIRPALLFWLIPACISVDSTHAASELGPPGSGQLTQEEIADGWIRLFDGETLFGWRPHGGTWRVVDGMIVCDGDTDCWLGTTTEFSDFILRLQYRVSPKGNGGVFFRAKHDGEPWHTGYEMEIWDESPDAPTGSIFGLATARRRDEAKAPGSSMWHDVEIRAERDHLTVILDGERVAYGLDNKSARGVIGLQRALSGTKIRFANIRLKPLGLTSIFNGKDLKKWNVLPGHKSKFSVGNGTLNVKGGPGQIETQGEWQDFVLQLEVMTNGNHADSGICFRGIPGKRGSGYESQIRNEWRGSDRNNPVDFGTGGIYGRRFARKVVPSDRQWFTKTIVCHDNHMVVWVDGYQVSDFTDTRQRGVNVAERCRIESGPIGLQGRDATTDVSFRNIRIAEYLIPMSFDW